MITAAALDGKDWIEAENMVSSTVIKDLYKDCLNDLEDAFESYRNEISSENEDRIEFQLNVLKQHASKQRNTIEQRIQNFELSNKTKMIPAERGKLRKLEGRIEDRRQELLSNRQMSASSEDVSSGIIYVF